MKTQTNNQAEQEVIEKFCRELALALRRITGRTVELPRETLPEVLEKANHPSVSKEVSSTKDRSNEQPEQ